VLVSVGFAESHLDGHNGRPSQANGYGVMHLVSNNHKTMSEAIKLTGLPVDKLSKDNSHYVIRSSDGQVTQMVAEKDTAWRA